MNSSASIDRSGKVPGKLRSGLASTRTLPREQLRLPTGISVIRRVKPAGRLFLPSHATWLVALVLTVGCRRDLPEDLMVVTQSPVIVSADFAAVDLLDTRYPPGSRVVVVRPGSKGTVERVLSAGFHSAGGPVVEPAGERVLFVGKAVADAAWQIYESSLAGASPVQKTAVPRGAMGPVYLPDGRIAFSSPVPRHGRVPVGTDSPELYAKPLSDKPLTRLTFGLAGATEATVLADGRILFVSGGTIFSPVTNQALFTINSDGTEISPFAAQHDGRSQVTRPRQTADGRVLFLSSEFASSGWDGQLEEVRMARPFSSRATVQGMTGVRLRAVEPAGDGRVLVTTPGNDRADFGIYALNTGEIVELGREPVFDDPRWHEVEVAVRRPGPRPMGRLSTVTDAMRTGRLLCLDANDIGIGSTDAVARSVRFFRPSSRGNLESLGEIPLQADGSFLAEVPADTLLGLETLDENGRVVGRLPPSFWVRPGENRSCVGCHEPHNSCPENRRPLAVRQPSVKLDPDGGDLAHKRAKSP